MWIQVRKKCQLVDEDDEADIFDKEIPGDEDGEADLQMRYR